MANSAVERIGELQSHPSNRPNVSPVPIEKPINPIEYIEGARQAYEDTMAEKGFTMFQELGILDELKSIQEKLIQPTGKKHALLLYKTIEHPVFLGEIDQQLRSGGNKDWSYMDRAKIFLPGLLKSASHITTVAELVWGDHFQIMDESSERPWINFEDFQRQGKDGKTERVVRERYKKLQVRVYPAHANGYSGLAVVSFFPIGADGWDRTLKENTRISSTKADWQNRSRINDAIAHAYMNAPLKEFEDISDPNKRIESSGPYYNRKYELDTPGYNGTNTLYHRP